jgi:membrane protease YdiL (CAAX protease family)
VTPFERIQRGNGHVSPYQNADPLFRKIPEELLFRGFLFWLLFQFTDRVSIFHRHESAVTVLVIAVAFALSHTGRAGLPLFTTTLTGAAYGWMRVQSGSTAVAALMHGAYNPAISCISTL